MIYKLYLKSNLGCNYHQIAWNYFEFPFWIFWVLSWITFVEKFLSLIVSGIFISILYNRVTPSTDGQHVISRFALSLILYSRGEQLFSATGRLNNFQDEADRTNIEKFLRANLTIRCRNYVINNWCNGIINNNFR